MKTISLLGDIVVDLLSEEGEYTFTPVPGGSIFNTACTLAKLESKVSFYSAVGKDFWGKYLIRFMNNLSINTSTVFQLDNYKTSVAFACIDSLGNASYDFYKPEKQVKLEAGQLENSSIFHFGSFFALKKNNRQTIKKFIKKAEKNDLIISYDPNFRKNHTLSTFKNDILSYFKHSHLIKASIEDLEYIFGVTKISDAFKTLYSYNPVLSIVTLGKEGAVASINKKPFVEVEAEVINAVDTVGAGDNFTAGMLHYLNRENISTREMLADMTGDQLFSMLEFANKTAAASLKVRGAQVSTRDVQLLKEFLL